MKPADATELIRRYRELFAASALFRGMADGEIAEALLALRARQAAYPRGALLHGAETELKAFGLVLSGSVQACIDDPDGGRLLLADVRLGRTFGEALCWLRDTNSPVYLLASEECGVLWLDPAALRAGGSGEVSALRDRFTSMLAARTLEMSERIQVLSRARLREKLTAYLTRLSAEAQSRSFILPLNRENTAAYLGVNRSAMCRELSAMQRDGILRLEGRRVTLHPGNADNESSSFS